MSKKKILVLSLSFPTKFSPRSGIFVINQLEYLKKDYDIKVICPYPYVPQWKFLNPFQKFSSVPFKEKVRGIEVYRPRYLFFPRNTIVKIFLSFFLLLESWLLYFQSKEVVDKLARSWDFDLVHTHELISGRFLTGYIQKKYKKKILITLHGEDVTRYSNMFLLKSAAKTVFKQCHTIVAVSKSLENEAHALNLTKKKMEIIPSGYHVGRFKILDKQKCREKTKLPKNKKIIIFVGWLIQRKGVEYLVRAMSRIVKKDEDVYCCILGKGDQEDHLKNLVRELKLGKNVRFVGEVMPDDLPLWVNTADVSVLPSLNEGLPSVIGEALACGKPVVATRVAGNPEIVTNEVGFLVSPKNEKELADKIMKALHSSWDKKKLVKRAREFSVTASVKKLKQIYKKV